MARLCRSRRGNSFLAHRKGGLRNAGPRGGRRGCERDSSWRASEPRRRGCWRRASAAVTSVLAPSLRTSLGGGLRACQVQRRSSPRLCCDFVLLRHRSLRRDRGRRAAAEAVMIFAPICSVFAPFVGSGVRLGLGADLRSSIFAPPLLRLRLCSDCAVLSGPRISGGGLRVVAAAASIVASPHGLATGRLVDPRRPDRLFR